MRVMAKMILEDSCDFGSNSQQGDLHKLWRCPHQVCQENCPGQFQRNSWLVQFVTRSMASFTWSLCWPSRWAFGNSSFLFCQPHPHRRKQQLCSALRAVLERVNFALSDFCVNTADISSLGFVTSQNKITFTSLKALKKCHWHFCA